MQEPGWHILMPVAELVPGQPTEITIDGEPVLLIRRGDSVTACAAICPHKFTPLVDGTVEAGCITCPLHGATFDLATGRPRPDQAWAGTLPIHPVRIRDGRVEVRLPPSPFG